MRILAIGDIHGRNDAFGHLLNRLTITSEDTVITLGDYVDRGPDSRAVIDRLIALSTRCRLIPLRGNHDVMMMNARTDRETMNEWRELGGEATLQSYGSFAQVPAAHWDFLERQCVDYWECETHFFVHGGVYPDVPLADQPTQQLHWGRFDNALPHISGKTMVCGHTSQKDGYPKNLGYAVCIDTWAYAGQWLTCLDIGSGAIVQADLDGEHRVLRLDALQPVGRPIWK